MLLFWTCAMTHAAAPTPWAPSEGHGWGYLGLSRSSFSTETWADSNTFVLPASVTTWALDFLGEARVVEKLVFGGRMPLVYSDARIENSSTCNWGGMCDDVIGIGDLSIWVRGSWEVGRTVASAGLEATSALGYRHGLDDLAAPGDGNNDLALFSSWGFAGHPAGLEARCMAGVRIEAGLGVPPPALEGEVQASLRRGPLEAGISWSRYDSLGGLDFNTATSTPDFVTDPKRFAVMENDYQVLAPRISVLGSTLGVHLSGWHLLAVRNGPKDDRGASLGFSSWW